ncbi:MAG: CopD family protein [Cyclobacteriaceae bacterium]
MTFLYIKALHIIFVVTWFAGLFYIIRLFIYQTESYDKAEPERSILAAEYKRISRLLWYFITWPSAILTLGFGWSLFFMYPPPVPIWLWVKLGLVSLLFGYQIYTHIIFEGLQYDKPKHSSNWLRVWNEVATVLLVSIIFLVILKNTLSMAWGLIGLVIFATVLMIAIQLYKKKRSKNL